MNNKLLPTLWIFLTVNYIFCDVFSLYHADFLNQLILGHVDGIKFTEKFLLTFAILMEIPMIMILLSKILNDKLNRIFNMLFAFLMIFVQIGSLITGENSLHYLFFSIIEIMILLTIIWIAWKWIPLKTIHP